MSEVKKHDLTEYGMGDLVEYAEWTLEVELPESKALGLPVIAEGWPYFEYTYFYGITGTYGVDRHGEALLKARAAGLAETRRIVVLFRSKFGIGEELWNYKIRLLSLMEGEGLPSEIIKSGVFYRGEHPRRFFDFFGVDQADITALLEAE